MYESTLWRQKRFYVRVKDSLGTRGFIDGCNYTGEMTLTTYVEELPEKCV